jgi:thioredoxin-like negative regulator of GroEL
MFKRSFFLVIALLALVFTSAFAAQLWITKDLPSTYDTGLTIEKAFKTSKAPLLIEFYSDTCGACRRVAPVVHQLMETRYKGRLTTVMMDVDDADTRSIAELFGVNTLPALYVFDHHHMKKHVIPAESFVSTEKLTQTIDGLLQRTNAAVTNINTK